MRSSGIAWVGLVLACGGDGDDGTPIDAVDNDAPTIDADDHDAAPDAMVDAGCPGLATGQVGGPCTTDAQCDSAAGAGDGICLRGLLGAITWPAQGYCINQIESCTDDADCGAGNACVTVSDPAGSFRACFPACGTGDCACAAGQLCAGSFSGATFAAGDTACVPGNAAATDGDACAGFGDCAEDSACVLDPFEHPGGQCQRLGCTIGDDATCAAGGDGHCVDQLLITTGFQSGAVCVDACAIDADCRMADGYRCFDGGGTVGRFCRHPQAGDACMVDGDCGADAEWDCKTGVAFPGGMCTPTTGCPTPGLATGCSPGSSACFDSLLPGVPNDNVCVDRCAGPIGTQAGCRAGYVCRDADPSATTTLGCISP
jgi:hypothetical protein